MINKSASLAPSLLAIIQQKGTEPPFSGEYNTLNGKGTYLCRQCGFALFRSHTQFHSGCGWPSFDDPIVGAVVSKQDADGIRTEILCARCNAHLGHVFSGEQYTVKNTRHCVNSLSLDFVADTDVTETEEAIFAGGCFWGIEYYFQQLSGVLKTEVGYIGGQVEGPSYEIVCAGGSGHYEAVRVIFNPHQLSYEQLTKFFFEIHDPTQTNGQGPDIGEQYKSSIFYYDDKQKKIALALIDLLEKSGLSIATKILPVSPFWRAEKKHQSYYAKNGQHPYCHYYTKRF